MRQSLYSQRRQSGHGLGGRLAQALLPVGAALVLFGSEVQAQSVSGYECCLSLLQPYGARAVALGFVERNWDKAAYVGGGLVLAWLWRRVPERFRVRLTRRKRKVGFGD